MNELQLVGYTADYGFLVFSDPDDDSVRFSAAVDADLIETLREVLELGGSIEGVDAVDAGDVVASNADDADEPESLEPPQPEPQAEPPHQATHRSAPPAPVISNGDAHSLLSPREIQALLRAGKSPSVVARQAGVAEDRVLRWLPPIEAERDQIIQSVQRTRLSKPRLGASADVLGDAVRANLAAKGIDVDAEAQWTATRKSSRDVWTVTLRYRSRGHAQRAVWRFNPDAHRIEARNELAAQVGWTRPRGSAKTGAGQRKRSGTPKGAAAGRRSSRRA